MKLTRISRKYGHLTLIAKLYDGDAAEVGGVEVALLRRGHRPDVSTPWPPVEFEEYRVLGSDGSTISAHAEFAEALVSWQSAPTGSVLVSVWVLLMAGPDADPAGAIAVPATSSLWARVVDNPEVDAAMIDVIEIG